MDQELPDDIGTQMVFMSQREGEPDHFLWCVLYKKFLQTDTLLKSEGDELHPPTEIYIISKQRGRLKMSVPFRHNLDLSITFCHLRLCNPKWFVPSLLN